MRTLGPHSPLDIDRVAKVIYEGLGLDGWDELQYDDKIHACKSAYALLDHPDLEIIDTRED